MPELQRRISWVTTMLFGMKEPHERLLHHHYQQLHLTLSLSVLLLSVSDSAPEEVGLWPPVNLVIHGGRSPCCHGLLGLSMLCWGISKGRYRGGR